MVQQVSGDDGTITAKLSDATEVSADRLLVATGRRVVLDGLGLDAAGIDDSGGVIAVNERLQAAPGIWAIGDVTGLGMFTHVAMYQGSIAVADLLGQEPTPERRSPIPKSGRSA